MTTHGDLHRAAVSTADGFSIDLSASMGQTTPAIMSAVSGTVKDSACVIGALPDWMRRNLQTSCRLGRFHFNSYDLYSQPAPVHFAASRHMRPSMTMRLFTNLPTA